MNPLKNLQIISTIFKNQQKLYKTINIFLNKQNNFSQLTNEATLRNKKMLQHQHHQYNFHELISCLSTDQRFWKVIPSTSPNDIKKPGCYFKIVSYNILAQKLLLDHIHLYIRSNQNYLHWNYRLDRLTEKIVEQGPQIICLQEVQENHVNDIMNRISSKLPSMACVFKQKTGEKPDGCAIIYDKQFFNLISSNHVEFYRPEVQLLDRHNIALIAKFECKKEKRAKLLVSTTHLLFNPRRQDVRLAQTMVLLAELDRYSTVEPGKPDRIPIILTGDFNFDANSAPFELITKGKLCYENLTKGSLRSAQICGPPPTGKSFISDKLGITDSCRYLDGNENNPTGESSDSETTKPKDTKLFSTGTLSHNLNLCSAYNHFEGVSYGSIHQSGWVTIDHLFYSKKLHNQKHGSLKLTSILQLPTVDQCLRMGPLPNMCNGSDHLMLAANFWLRFPKKK